MRRVTLYHHPDCEKCRQKAVLHGWFNWFGTLTVSTLPPPTGPLVPGAIAVENPRTGQTVLGIRAVRWLAAAVPAYWPILPLLYVPFVARRIDREARGCADGGCAVPAHAEAQS